MTEELRKAALEYHAFPTPGKIGIPSQNPAQPSKIYPLAYTQVLQNP